MASGNVCSIACSVLDNVPIFSAEYTLTDGISPSRGIIRCAPSGNLTDIYGSLVLSDTLRTVTIETIVITNPQAAADTGGQEVILTFEDARYFWQFGQISGHYNVRKPDNSLDTRTEKKPQELATLLLNAMPGIVAFDVTALPNDTRPEFEWDYANPAQELAKLCDQLNCRIAWWIDNTVTIVVAGQGALLDGSLPSESQMIDLTIKPRPDKIILVGAPKLWQLRIPLEAVARGTDLKYRKLEDVDYEPTTEWPSEPNNMDNVIELQTYAPDGSRFSPRELALADVFRAYRIFGKDSERLAEHYAMPNVTLRDALKGAGVVFPSGAKLEEADIEHLLPLRSELTDQYIDTDGSKQNKPAFALGTFWHPGRPDDENSPFWTKVDDASIKVHVSQSVNAKEGIVHFSMPLRYFDSDEKLPEAHLWFYTATTLRDPKDRMMIRFTKELIMPGVPQNTGPLIIRHEDVQWKAVTTYDPIGNPTVTNNQAECDQMADYYLNAARDSFLITDAASQQIVGIWDGYRIDGAILQLTWAVESGEGGGAITIASRSTQHDVTVPDYKRRREDELRMKAESVRLTSEWKTLLKKTRGQPA